jgi:hypothetical protein
MSVTGVNSPFLSNASIRVRTRGIFTPLKALELGERRNLGGERVKIRVLTLSHGGAVARPTRQSL